MAAALFITIGSRDVRLVKQSLAGKFNEEEISRVFQSKDGRPELFLARPGGKLLLENWAKVHKEVSYPILTPFLNYILKSPLFFDQVYLVATNQDSELVGDHALQDTIYFAEIVKKYLGTTFSKADYVPFKRITILQVTENVIYLDAMFNYFKERLGAPVFQGLENTSEIHLCNQGGIDAINTGLMLQLLYRFGEKVRLYNINEQTKLCTPLEFQAQFGYEQEKARLRHAIARHDYAAAKALDIPDVVKTWCAYAESRLNFDFYSAGEHLSKLGIAQRAKRDYEIIDLEGVQLNEDRLTGELYWNAIIRYQQEAYVDFVQRFFRIVEQIARNEVQKILDFPFDHRRWQEDFVNTFLKKSEHSALEQHLMSFKMPGGAELNYRIPNIEVFKAILKYDNFKMFDFLESLSPLAQLRNKGIGAHGFSPIGKKQVLKCMNQDEPTFELTLFEIKKLLDAGQNPYERIRTIILDLVKSNG